MRCLAPLAASLFLATGEAQDLARMEQVVQQRVDAGEFTGSVLVAQGDRILFNKAYGLANRRQNVANTPDTQFSVASVTKQFTAASILLLEDRGKLSTQDAIGRYIDNVPAAWSGITLQHLLAHTSGLPNYTDFVEYPTLRNLPMSRESLLALLQDRPLEFTPGTKMAYSNSGYQLLGYVVQQVSGMPYEQFVQQNILVPLGMKDSGFDPEPHAEHWAEDRTRRADGYITIDAKVAKVAYAHPRFLGAAGGLYSTTGDLLRWQLGLYGGRLLSAASLQKMVTPVLNGFALGLMVQGGERVAYAHTGSGAGFRANLIYYPQSQVTVAMLGNLEGSVPLEVADKLARLALGEAVTLAGERQSIQLAPAVLEQYAGSYVLLTPAMTLTIALEGDQLLVRQPGRGAVRMFAEARDRFFTRVADVQMEFVRSGEQITELILRQGGRESKARRVATERDSPTDR